MQHTYYDMRTAQGRPIPGRVYWVSLPTIPAAAHEYVLVAHRNPAGAGWVVAHYETSAVIGSGRTRAEAIRDAQAALVSAAPGALEAAVARVAAVIGPRPSP